MNSQLFTRLVKNQVVFFSLAMIAFVACDEDKKGNGIGAPDIKKPIEENAPSALKTDAVSLTADGDSNSERILSAIKTYLFPSEGDASGPLERVDSIQGRIASLNKRSLASQKKCLTESPKVFDSAAYLPEGFSFPMELQCLEKLSSTAELAFGKSTDGSKFYVAERNSKDEEGRQETITVFAQANTDETESKIVQINTREENSKQTVQIVQILGTDSSKGIEVVRASGKNISGSSTDCTFKIKTSDSLIYFEGSLNISGPVDGEFVCTDQGAHCFSYDGTVITAQDDASACTEKELDVFVQTALTYQEAIDSTSELVTDNRVAITGYTSFNEDADES